MCESVACMLRFLSYHIVEHSSKVKCGTFENLFFENSFSGLFNLLILDYIHLASRRLLATSGFGLGPPPTNIIKCRIIC